MAVHRPSRFPCRRRCRLGPDRGRRERARSTQTTRAIGRPLSPPGSRASPARSARRASMTSISCTACWRRWVLRQARSRAPPSSPTATAAQGLIRLSPGDGALVGVPSRGAEARRLFREGHALLRRPHLRARFPLALPEPSSDRADRKALGRPPFETILHRPSYREAFVEELLGWWSAIAEGAAVVNTAEAARRDMALLASLGRVAIGGE